MNTTLVGAFVLLLAAAGVVVVLWLASGGAMRKQYEPYLAILNESVAGLNVNAPVKLNGVNVGRVRSIRLDPLDSEQVRLVFDIERGTPVKVDTEAVLKTQGLTGIAYVELSGGTQGAALLRPTVAGEYPEIQTKPSLSARLENVLTNALTKLDRTTSNIDAVLSDANQRAISSALADIAAVARAVAARKDTIDAGIVNAARTFDHGARATAQLGPVIERIGRGAQAVEKMGNETALASASAGRTLDQVGADVQRFTADTLPELQRLMGELTVLSVSLRHLTEQTERNPNSLLFGRGAVPAGPGENTGGPKPP